MKQLKLGMLKMQGSSFVGDGKGVNERERLRDQTNTQQDDDWTMMNPKCHANPIWWKSNDTMTFIVNQNQTQLVLDIQS
ncbi:hypothetical protein FDP41_002155 [Naegleria fowleri]|uniref:Uncharacterized protein n=1 Tax=Naegleria fowleri TaxID=5763 RepID=A0A6A5C0N6_NAEFO|nr:uncharacterized protein FDP41_002155 [Naegleria fowleri]KAF0979085.1 hypothetical protein FDP41_002155 [Naegleria fowleri]